MLLEFGLWSCFWTSSCEHLLSSTCGAQWDPIPTACNGL